MKAEKLLERITLDPDIMTGKPVRHYIHAFECRGLLDAVPCG
jgi:hypothetical protein